MNKKGTASPTLNSGPQDLVGDVIKNTIVCGDSAQILDRIPNNTQDLILTSPPYDNARANKNYNAPFDFEKIAQSITRILKNGAICIWNVNDMVQKDGGKSCTSFEQILYFRKCGLILHDTIYFLKSSFAFPGNGGRYHNVIEPCYILSKGRPSKVNLLKDRKNKSKVSGGPSGRNQDGSRRNYQGRKQNTEYGMRFNVWGPYSIGGNHTCTDKTGNKHPALMHEKLAEDLILSYSSEGQSVLDCFSGAGTSGIMAHKNKRDFTMIEISNDYCILQQERFKERFGIDVPIIK